MLLQAGNPGDLEIVTGQPLRITVTNYLVMPETRMDEETGELHSFARTVLFTRDGKHFRSSSAHFPHRIKACLELFGPEEWARGIMFEIRERPSKRHKGGSYHDIRVVPCDQIEKE